ncbi:MAG: cytidine deaminase [Bacteroidota bacterium]
MNYVTLVKHAKAARKNSHSPYSRFRVGAALLTSDNTLFTGCNIEISTYALTLCAERTAIFKARSDGFKNFKAIAIATDESEYIPPCGACRQVLMDLAGDIDIILSNKTRKPQVMKLSSLLPMAFGPRNLRHPKR